MMKLTLIEKLIGFAAVIIFLFSCQILIMPTIHIWAALSGLLTVLFLFLSILHIAIKLEVPDESEQYPEKQKRGPIKTQLNYDKYIRALDALDDGVAMIVSPMRFV
jgi:hypothetical protein